MKRRIFKDLATFFDETDETQAAFAKRVAVSQAAISMFRNKKRTPSLRMAQRIASAARIPIESLLSETD